MAEYYVAYTGPTVKRSDAVAASEKFYFSGKPCKNGHLTQRSTANGTCPVCRLSYVVDKEKRRACQKRWADTNRERVRARGRAYSKANMAKKLAYQNQPENREKRNSAGRNRYQKIKSDNPDLIREKWRRDYKTNPKAGVARVQKWQAANQDALRQYRLDNADAIKLRNAEWTKANPDKVSARLKKYRLAHPEVGKNWKKANPEKVRAIKQNRRARERNAEGRHTAAEIKALFAQQNGQCVYCKVSIASGYDADHIQPLSRGGSNWISNIQLLCESCNSRKWALDHDEFVRRLKLKAA